MDIYLIHFWTRVLLSYYFETEIKEFRYGGALSSYFFPD